jgi:alkanesulfonate monooxygenase SsuD/methylene tetrahydromethanopterin reductase-like flavin-dependent oxidoreductase (luciferase family)
LLQLLAGSRGHASLSGTPESIADLIAEWFQQGAADGFMLMPHAFPSEFQLFVDEVVPLLRRRGLLRNGERQAGLRERLGLPMEGLGERI